MCARIVILLILSMIVNACGKSGGGPAGSVETESCILDILSQEQIIQMKNYYSDKYETNLSSCRNCDNFKSEIIKGLTISQSLENTLDIEEYSAVIGNTYYLKSIIYLFEQDTIASEDLLKISCGERK